VKIAEWNSGSSTRIHRQHHQNDGVFDGVGEPFGAGTIMALNHIQITNAKPRDKAFKLADSDGLYLFQPNGAKLWRMNYRHLGRQKTLYFGAWPEIGIAAARQLREKAREQIAAGLDPAAEKRVENLARKVAADNTFKTIAEEWVGKNEREGRAPITLDKIRKRGGRWEQIRLKGMARHFRLFDQPATAITGPDIAEWRDIRLRSVSPSAVTERYPWFPPSLAMR
jgi:hypothetical protein